LISPQDFGIILESSLFALLGPATDVNDEVCMQDFRQLGESTLREEIINSDSPQATERAALCTYNQTGQRFISDDVELVEESEGDFEDCYSTLLPGSGTAIWIVPARDLTTTSFCIPVDLLYLDAALAVLATVESFPLQRASSIERAASILALPKHTVLTMGIEAGDQLMLCSPKEIQRYLVNARPIPLEAGSNLDDDDDESESRLAGWEQQLGEVREEMDTLATSPVQEPLAPSVEADSNLNIGDGKLLGWDFQFGVAHEETDVLAMNSSAGPAKVEEEEPAPVAVPPSVEADSTLNIGDGKLLGWDFQLGEAHEETDVLAMSSSAEPAKVEEEELAPVAVPPRQAGRKPPKVSWWLKLLLNKLNDELNKPNDQRWGERKVLPGLVAYFFTGGPPTPHPVHDISTSGLFVLTSERWYRGTYVRLTLTDECEPRTKRPITLHGKVVRATDNGVAFEFLLSERHRGFASMFNELPRGVGVKDIRQFVAQFESYS
jgi:hypothetical protein